MDLAHPARRERLEELAGHYVLGTLRGPARARFARALRSDPAVASAVREWEERLACLAAAVPDVNPSKRVWTGIAERLGFASTMAGDLGWWQRLGFWRGFGLASFAAAVILSVLVLTQGPAVPGESLVVVLAGTDERPAMIATTTRNGEVLTLKAVTGATPGPGRAFELWALPQGAAPRSLGVIPTGSVARVMLGPEGAALLARVPALAVSLEPRGGSPTGQPTGPVVYSGKVERFF
jgi:anti-sigma-K factor RskA